MVPNAVPHDAHPRAELLHIDRLPTPVQELAHEEVVRQLQLEQAKQVTKLRQEVEQGARDLASKADRRMKVTTQWAACTCAWAAA